MTTLQQLLDFIQANPPGNEHWFKSNWNSELSKSLPGWENIVKDPNNWPHIEAIRCNGDFSYYYLCEVLLHTASDGLAIRWLDSAVPEQKKQAHHWVHNRVRSLDKFSVALWAGLNKQETKMDIIYNCFNSYPGEPFTTWREWRERREWREWREWRDWVLMPVTGYVPSPQIMKLRAIVEAAGDHKSLEIIDDFIDRHDRACKSNHKQDFSYTPTRDEQELIAIVLSIARDSGYRSAALPQIFLSFEAPPIFVAYPELEDDSDSERKSDRRKDPIQRERRPRPEYQSIEEVLGCYVPDSRIVILYARGLRWYAKRKNLDEEMLRAVVLVHEIGHWVTHLLPKPSIPEWPLELYKLTEEEVHEGWAQLITWWVVDKVKGKIENTFNELNKSQSAPYQVYQKFQTKNQKSVMDSLERLRQMRWPARLVDWKRLCP